MMKLAVLLALTLATSASAQVQVIEGDAMKPQADVMRSAWKASPKKPVGVTVPLYGRVMAFNMLRPFVPAYQAQNDHQFIMEYLPDGQNFDNWTEMVTVTGVKGGDQTELTHPQLVDQIFNTLDGCDRGFYYRSLRSASTGDVSALVVNRSCAHVVPGSYPGAADIGEQNMIVHFRDGKNSYSLQYSVRRKYKADKAPFTDATIETQLARFGEITLCTKDEVCNARFSYGKPAQK